MKLHCFVSVLSVFFFVSKTKWFSGLHLVVLFLSWLFCVFFVSSFLSKKRPQKIGHSKNPQNQKCRKKGQIKNSVSAVVFTNIVFLIFGGGLQKCDFLLKTL